MARRTDRRRKPRAVRVSAATALPAAAPAKQRLFASPSRPNALASGGKAQLGETTISPSDSAPIGLNARDFVTKPLKTRVRLIHEAFKLMRPGAPFVQFTYAVMPPIPKALSGVTTEASERIWMNLPPARVWVYRKR